MFIVEVTIYFSNLNLIHWQSKVLDVYTTKKKKMENWRSPNENPKLKKYVYYGVFGRGYVKSPKRVDCNSI